MIYSDHFYKELERENSEELVLERTNHYNNVILPFYKSEGKPFVIEGQNEIPISCLFFKPPAPKAKILIVTGYNESYLKYAEFIKNLFELNISVYCYDHRGQGFSGRFPKQKNRGYIDKFSFLVDDLCLIFNHVSQDENSKLPLYVIAHSMGGAVTAQALCEQKINPAHAILASPMFEIMLTPWSALENIVYAISKTAAILGCGKQYAFGQKDCVPFLPFDGNDVTNSKFRFLTWRKHLSEIPVLQLGGPSFQWLSQSIQASKKIRTGGSQALSPILILQAEEDIVVRNSAQDLFVENCPKAKKIIFGHAQHEIFMEIDFIRSKAFDVIKNIIK